MQRGTFTVGDFALFVSYIWPMGFYIRYFGKIMARQKRSRSSLDRLDKLLADAPEGPWWPTARFTSRANARGHAATRAAADRWRAWT